MEQVVSTLSRRDRERLTRRSEILSAAQEVIAEKGYGEATLEEIAARAEYGKGTLYNYFPGGKKEILLSIFELFYDQLCTLIEETFSPGSKTPFRNQLNTFFEQTFSFFLKRTELFVTLLREAHRIGFSDESGSRKFFMGQKNRALDALATPLRLAMDRGELRETSPRFLAHLILVNINGCQMKSCMGPAGFEEDTPASASEMAEFLTDMVYDGIKSSQVIPK